MIAIVTATVVFVPPPNASALEHATDGLVSFLVAALIIVGAAYGLALIRAPYEQRDAQTAALGRSRERITQLQAEIVRLNTPPPAPAFRLADRLEPDPVARCFRLRVWNESATAARPCVEIISISDRNQAPLLDPTQLPLELTWTHHEGGRPTLSVQDQPGRTVAVFLVDRPANAAEAELVVYGRQYRASLGRIHERLRGENIYVTIAVRSPEHAALAPVERAYVLRHDAAAPLRFVP